jgi:hypothetical protein
MSDNKYPDPPTGTHKAIITFVADKVSKKGFKMLQVSFKIGDARITDWIINDPKAFDEEEQNQSDFFYNKYNTFLREIGGRMPPQSWMLKNKEVTLTIIRGKNEKFPFNVKSYGGVAQPKQQELPSVDQSEDVPF